MYPLSVCWIAQQLNKEKWKRGAGIFGHPRLQSRTDSFGRLVPASRSSNFWMGCLHTRTGAWAHWSRHPHPNKAGALKIRPVQKRAAGWDSVPGWNHKRGGIGPGPAVSGRQLPPAHSAVGRVAPPGPVAGLPDPPSSPQPFRIRCGSCQLWKRAGSPPVQEAVSRDRPPGTRYTSLRQWRCG